MSNYFLQYISNPRTVKTIHIRYLYRCESIRRVPCPLLCELIDLISLVPVLSRYYQKLSLRDRCSANDAAQLLQWWHTNVHTSRHLHDNKMIQTRVVKRWMNLSHSCVIARTNIGFEKADTFDASNVHGVLDISLRDLSPHNYLHATCLGKA